jgi:O-Antigen ligase
VSRRSRLITGARWTLLACPLVLAFFTGGYFTAARNWAGLVVWALVAVSALTTRGPLLGSRASKLALAGLALFALWTLMSFLWSPIEGTAYSDGQRVILYTGALLAAASLFRGRSIRLIEPAVAGTSLIVIGYGMSERLLPWLLTFQRSASAEGRLEQPLTYWNAMGAEAAIGLVLCAHLAGESGRSPRMRIAAALASAPLGLGLYCSFSRGAIFACIAGLVCLAVLAPTRSGLRGIVLAFGAAVLAAGVSAPFSGVTSLAGSSSSRAAQGTVTLVLLIVIVTGAAFAQRTLIRREQAGTVKLGAVRLPRHAGWLAGAAVVACFAVFLLVGSSETSAVQLSGGASRLTSLQSDRYDYWRIAWRAFRSEPLRGVGGGGWAVDWLRYRPEASGAQDAHSLYFQTAAELGVVGLALLASFFGGVIWAARSAFRRFPGLTAGPTAGLVVWAAHAAIDWDWEMPAVTLLAILLAGGVLALSSIDSHPAVNATARP